MLGYTIELISLAASNSLAVFCFCNLIIAILLIGSSKTSTRFDQEGKNLNAENLKKLEGYASEEASHALIDEEKVLPSVSIDMVEEEEEESPEEGEGSNDDDDDDDELRQRVEDFIEKINSGWRAEKKTRLSLGQQLSLDHHNN